MKKRYKYRISKSHFRVAIFGSARIKRGDPEYKRVYNLAKMIADVGIDIVTGGGPGLMDAASRGHHAGRKSDRVHSLGLTIWLPKEQKEGFHLDIKKEYSRFSKRLDNFMALSNLVVVAPGGVGTLLEFLYTWQLIQVGHICDMPIVLVGKMWRGLIQWVKKWPLKHSFMNKKDLDTIFFADNSKEAMKIINKAYEHYKKDGKNVCLNIKKYRIR